MVHCVALLASLVPAHESSTKNLQLHKCSTQDCGLIKFPIKKLAETFQDPSWEPGDWTSTAWDISPLRRKYILPGKLKLANDAQEFVAFSHVWSDGTGVGVNKQGVVNRCLAEFWGKIAQRLGCHAFWWDTVCVPVEKEPRRKSLNVMLHNFSRAKYTVIHDKGLIKIPWTSGGSAVVAITLSTWFTRAWTAAELYSNRSKEDSVKVLFRNANPGILEPEIKDLRKDILSYDTGIPALAHLNAMNIIREVFDDVYNITILRRY